MQTISPFAKRRIRISKQPRDASDIWKLCLAGSAAIATLTPRQWCLVAAWTRDHIAKKIFNHHELTVYEGWKACRALWRVYNKLSCENENGQSDRGVRLTVLIGTFQFKAVVVEG